MDSIIQRNGAIIIGVDFGKNCCKKFNDWYFNNNNKNKPIQKVILKEKGTCIVAIIAFAIGNWLYEFFKKIDKKINIIKYKYSFFVNLIGSVISFPKLKQRYIILEKTEIWLVCA